MTQTLILIFAVLVPLVITVFIFRAWKKNDQKGHEFPEQYESEENKNGSN